MIKLKPMTETEKLNAIRAILENDRAAKEAKKLILAVLDADNADQTANEANEEAFEDAFRAVFPGLDRAGGGYNHVSLVELRQALPTFGREEFDSEIVALRNRRAIELTVAERRGGINEAEQQAAIEERGVLLLNVSLLK